MLSKSRTFETIQLNIDNSLYMYDTHYRRACSIADPDSGTVIVTGGYNSGGGTGNLNNVSKYGVTGWIENLEPLNFGRDGHGCGSYVSGEEKVV